MKTFLISWANDAHNFRSAFLRRVNLGLAVSLLALRSVAFWAIMPALVALLVVLGVLRTVIVELAEVPSHFSDQFSLDRAEWARHATGFKAIWRSVK